MFDFTLPQNVGTKGVFKGRKIKKRRWKNDGG